MNSVRGRTRFDFALSHLDHRHKQVIRHFIPHGLETVDVSQELNRIWHAANANRLFGSDADLRVFPGEIAQRIG
ncbi:MAG: hypothetical protein ACRECY_06705 [Phyllobacterium sp.]